MDPKLLLGVSARAGRAEVRAAHRRLRRSLDPSRGGTPELCRLLDRAAAALAGGASLEPGFDPHAVLGLAPGAPLTEIHGAYRRLARLVHPDLGGTDELFRVVGSAHDVLTGRRVDRHGPSTRRTARRASPPPWRPPPPPPPPPPRGPYRAPSPDERRSLAPWRAWRDLAQNGATLGAAAAGAATALYLGRVLALLVLLIASIVGGPVLRPAVDGVRRAVVVLLGARVRVAPQVEPERFLEETCLDTPVGRQRDDQLYRAYVRWCGSRGEPVAPWVFVERLRALGLLYIRPSGWDGALWVGITLKR